jgi:hypothetical protein
VMAAKKKPAMPMKKGMKKQMPKMARKKNC